MIRVIVAGSRRFNDYPLLSAKLDHLLQHHSEVEIVSGAASRADMLGERYALERGHPVKRFPANWSLGKRTGPIRNGKMVDYATHLVAFWNGWSRDTKNMIEQAQDKGLQVRVVKY